MLCICGSTLCECEGQCLCCPLTCLCEKCFKLRSLSGAHCSHCGGYVTAYVCRMMPIWRSGLYPNMNFTHPRTQTNSGSDERASLETSSPEGAQGSSTASRRCAPEDSQSPSRGSPSSDDSLQFQMDDIDFSPESSKNTSTGAKCRTFQGSPHSSSKSASGASLERESPSKIRKRLFPNYVKVTLKSRESTECKTPTWTPPQQPDDATASELRETRREMPIASKDVAGCSRPNPATGTSEIVDSRLTGEWQSGSATDSNQAELFENASTTMQDAPGCSFCNPNNKSISKNESKVSDKSPKHKVDGTGLEKTGSHESDIINKDKSSCSNQYKNASKQEEFSITDGASHAVQPSDEYASSDSLLSNLHLDDGPPSLLVTPRSSIRPLSTSVPSVYDCPKPTELKSSERKQSTSLCTFEQPSTSKLDALNKSNIRSIDQSKSSESSSSIEDTPELLPNIARYDVLHGEYSIPSDFSESSRLNNSELQAKSKEPGGTSQALQNSKLQSSEKSKSARQRKLTESDSIIKTISRENDSSEDEASTNKSPKKNNRS